MKNHSIFAKVRQQCPVCGEIAIYEGVFKEDHLKAMKKGKGLADCKCGHTMEIMEIVACQVMGSEMDPSKVELGVI